MTDAFCREFLDDEYATLCRKLAGILARKRPSPLIRGKPESWASGIVRVDRLGQLPQRPQPAAPHEDEPTSTSGWASRRRPARPRRRRSASWSRSAPSTPNGRCPAGWSENPLAWMIQVNGLIVDARRLPREIQEEAFRKGLIPYIPADRAGDPAEE